MLNLTAVLAVLTSSPASALDPTRQISQYAIRHWTPDEGLPHTSVTGLAQTADRYLWVGTQEGLARFDGVRFTYFGTETDPAFRSNFILSLLADSGGGLWIGTRGGGLVEMRNGVFRNWGAKEGMPGETIVSLAETSDGAIWAGTLDDGLARIHEGKATTISSKQGLPSGAVRALAAGPAGELWVGFSDAGIVRLEKGSFRHFTEADGLPSRIIRSLHLTEGGVLWIATGDAGIASMTEGVFTPYSSGDLEGASVRAIREDSDGNLWIGTEGKGLARLTGGRLSTYVHVEHAPLTADIWAILEDDEGTLWVGSHGGALTQFRDGKALIYATREGLPHPSATALHADRESGLWVAGFAGLSHFNGSRFESTNTTDDDPIFSLHQDRDGTLWAGSQSGRLIRTAGDGTASVYTSAHGLPSSSIFAVHRDPAGTLWVGTAAGLARMNNGRFTVLKAEDGLGSNVVRFIHGDAQGALWIATDGAGLTRYLNGRFSVWGTAQGFPSDFIRAIHQDDQGVLWIGTGGAGIVRVHDGRFQQFTTRQGLLHDTIYSIVEDPQGNLWCSTGRGIFSVSRAALNQVAAGRMQRVSSTVYARAAGLSTAALEGIGGVQSPAARTTNGRLWFSTAGGVVAIDPSKVQRNPRPPAVHIQEAIVDQSVIPIRNGSLVPPGSRSIEFRFTGISYYAPEGITFRYRLDNFDESWIEAPSRRSAAYTNLPPGEYAFRVIAANADGVWNGDGDVFRFELRPYYYQTIWFRLLLLLLLVAVIWQIMRVRLRLLQAETTARTAVLEESLARAQRMESLGHLASGIAHEFNNTMMSALPWAEALRKQRSEDPLVQKAAGNIREACLRARDITFELLNFAEPRPPAKEPVDLHELVNDQLRMIRPSFGPLYEVIVRRKPGTPPVEADAAQLRQVILNLALNARDAMPEGGIITVGIRLASESEHRLWGLSSDDWVVMSVSDSGRGMSEETKQKIFDPFFTTKSVGEGKGTGLGLSIVHRIIDQHGGRIIVDTDDHGSTFYVLFPTAAHARAGEQS